MAWSIQADMRRCQLPQEIIIKKKGNISISTNHTVTIFTQVHFMMAVHVSRGTKVLTMNTLL